MPARSPRLAATGFAVAVIAQLWMLYSPEGVGAGWAPPGSDKVVHALMFAIPVVLGGLAGLSMRVIVPVLVVHAPVSELIQHFVLPGRSGDPWDVVADLTGVLIGWLVLRHVLQRGARRPSSGEGAAAKVPAEAPGTASMLAAPRASERATSGPATSGPATGGPAKGESARVAAAGAEPSTTDQFVEREGLPV